MLSKLNKMLNVQSKGRERSDSQPLSAHVLRNKLKLKQNAPRNESSRLLSVRPGQLLELSSTELTSKS